MSEPTVAIIGLGLVGGSLAHDLAARGLRVLGHDTDAQTLAAAVRSGIVREALGDDLENLRTADWLVLAVPVDAAAGVLADVLPHLERLQLITDVGSTKREILRAAESLGLAHRVVGSHPLAGDHQRGWAAARAGLFAERRVFLCAGDAVEEGALRAARALWRMCGARTEFIDAAEHDRRMAWASHLPQALSSALAGTLAAAAIPREALGPGGRDMTRLAASSPDMWTGIALQNADALQPALAQLQSSIAQLQDALAAHDRCAVHAFFARSADWSAEREATPISPSGTAAGTAAA